MLGASNIHLSLGEKEILNGVSIYVDAGHCVAITGPSGCGKTTLLRTLCLLDQPATGIVSIDDVQYPFPCRLRRPPSIAYPNVTMVFQQFFLWPHLTNAENIALPLRVRGVRYRERLAEMCQLLGIESELPKYPNQSSIGQKQRVALARSLLLSPRYLLCDEVTSAQDSVHRTVIAACLLRFCANGGALIVVTHDHEFARVLDAEMLFMEHGTFVPEHKLEMP